MLEPRPNLPPFGLGFLLNQRLKSNSSALRLLQEHRSHE
ncbi:Unknown protein sequence [Pseudomonas syringae pv. maculicola]|nr:Unknown protein sequence [Pseudomonas syringae pv. maculicola]